MDRQKALYFVVPATLAAGLLTGMFTSAGEGKTAETQKSNLQVVVQDTTGKPSPLANTPASQPAVTPPAQVQDPLQTNSPITTVAYIPPKTFTFTTTDDSRKAALTNSEEGNGPRVTVDMYRHPVFVIPAQFGKKLSPHDWSSLFNSVVTQGVGARIEPKNGENFYPGNDRREIVVPLELLTRNGSQMSLIQSWISHAYDELAKGDQGRFKANSVFAITNNTVDGPNAGNLDYTFIPRGEAGMPASIDQMALVKE